MTDWRDVIREAMRRYHLPSDTDERVAEIAIGALEGYLLLPESLIDAASALLAAAQPQHVSGPDGSRRIPFHMVPDEYLSELRRALSAPPGIPDADRDVRMTGRAYSRALRRAFNDGRKEALGLPWR